MSTVAVLALCFGIIVIALLVDPISRKALTRAASECHRRYGRHR